MPRLRSETIRIKPIEATDSGPFDIYVGGGIACTAGSPNVSLEVGDAFAYFKAEPKTYVGVMDIYVQSLESECFTYFTWEMRMWDGKAGTTCPTSAPERQEISRFLGEISPTKIISTSRLRAAENKMVGGSFEIPPTLEGDKTICLSLWGNFNRQALIDELLADGGYAEEIQW